MIRFRPAILAAVLFGLALPPGAAGQSLRSDRNLEGPIQIDADDSIEWLRTEQRYVARGNARASQGGLTVRADELIAHYRPNAGGDNEIYQLEAKGQVRIVSDSETARSDRAVYDVNDRVLVMTGERIRFETAEDTIVARDSLEYYELQKRAVARGDALAIRGDRRVRADVLTAHFGENRGTTQMDRIEALGNVLVSTPTDIARARRGDYDPKRGIATLTGDVKITRGDSQLNGDRAEVNLETGESRLLAAPAGRQVRGLLVPRAGSGAAETR